MDYQVIVQRLLCEISKVSMGILVDGLEEISVNKFKGELSPFFILKTGSLGKGFFKLCYNEYT